MRITVAAVGKIKASPEKDLCDKYRRQLPWAVEFHEIEIKKSLPVAEKKRAEAAALLECCAKAPRIIALDEHGRTLSSQLIAEQFSRWQQAGDSHAAIILGGQDGLDDAVRKKADLVLSFGAMTWPHMLARAMLMEQLYRVHTILSGHPYHRE